jgi:glutamate carboxypeptidase
MTDAVRIRDRAVIDAVRALEPAARLQWRELVDLESPSTDAGALVRALGWIERALTELGASIDRVPAPRTEDRIGAPDGTSPGAGIAVARCGADDQRRLLICTHLDTVHAQWQGATTWAEAGSRVVGPGVADMKGGVMVALLALRALRQAGVHDLSWTMLATTDEETGSWASRDALAALAPGHLAAFIPEPAMPDGSIVVQRPGSARVSIEAFGRAAHAGRDAAMGISAVTALCEAVAAAARLADPPRRIVNMALLRGGEATNIIPDRAGAVGNIRWQTEDDGRALMAGLQALGRGGPNDLPNVVIDIEVNRPVKERTDAVEALVRCMQDAAGVLGLQVGAGFTGGVSDGNIVQAAGVPTLDGMGVRGGNLHRHDEFAELDSLGERAALLALTMLRVRDSIPA